MVEATGIARWVRWSQGTNDWFPLQVVAKAKDLGLVYGDKRRKLTWVEGRPCDQTPSNTGWGAERCGRVAVGTIGQTRLGQEARPLHVCKMHLNAHEKAAANMAAWRQEWAERDAAAARRADHVKRAEEVLAWAGPLLAELGIHPKTVTAGAIGERAGLLLPAEAIATLVEFATGERYPGPIPTTTTPPEEDLNR